MQKQCLLEASHLSKSFDDKQVIKDVSFSLARGEIGCLLGPSGCGKTTLLRSIAGFEEIQSGEIRINGTLVTDNGTMLPPEKRDIGMVFQDYALFPHLTVEENIGFGLRNKETKRITHLLDLVGLSGSLKYYPHELSGGQQQRVALARALAPKPSLLLLDEPFSNLDVSLRERLTTEIRDILKETDTTALMVTHNQFEAFSVADKIGVIFNGVIRQWDTSYAIYHYPVDLDVAKFVGDGAILIAEVCSSGSIQCGLGKLSGSFSDQHPLGQTINILIRPEDILHDDSAEVKATVIHKSFRGPNILYKLQLSTNESCLALVSSHHNHHIGEKIGIKPEVDNLVTFPNREETFHSS